ncbi:MAG: helix-turn-helix transcriptional regulator [Prevotella sp.]|nr:helix-turn-helix transcriptional regulator [Prevotella sp.]
MKDNHSIIAFQIKSLRKKYGLTQEELAYKSGVGLRFVRELEQGKPTLRMDKVNQVFSLFNMHLAAVELQKEDES